MGNSSCTTKKPSRKTNKKLSSGPSMIQASSAQSSQKNISSKKQQNFQNSRHTADTNSTDFVVSQLERSPFQQEQQELPGLKHHSLSTCVSKVSRINSQNAVNVGSFSEQSCPAQRVKNQQRTYQLEEFLFQRKQYMQERGFFSYTAQTVLPPPILMDPNYNSLKMRRKVQTLSTLKHITITKGIQDFKSHSIPTQINLGDEDRTAIEV